MQKTTDHPSPIASRAAARDALHSLRGWLTLSQLDAIGDACRGEEGPYFRGKVVSLAKLISEMPTTFQQDGKGDTATACLHYFTPACDWYIVEKDAGSATDTAEEFQIQAYGLSRRRGGDNLGYISIPQLLRHGAELDLYWSPRMVGEVRNSVSEDQMPYLARVRQLEAEGCTTSDAQGM